MKTEMQNNPNLTTKQILLPFIHNIIFNELEIICRHVPHWFEGDFNKLNLKSEIEKINEGTVKVKVYSSDATYKTIIKDMTIGKILKNNPGKIDVLMNFDQLIYELNNFK